MAKKFYYTRNPESIGGADARFQDDWGFKHKEDDIKWVNAELVDGLVEIADEAEALLCKSHYKNLAFKLRVAIDNVKAELKD